MQDILVLASEERQAEILSRQPNGSWPIEPVVVETGTLSISGIGFTAPLDASYINTHRRA